MLPTLPSLSIEVLITRLLEPISRCMDEALQQLDMELSLPEWSFAEGLESLVEPESKTVTPSQSLTTESISIANPTHHSPVFGLADTAALTGFSPSNSPNSPVIEQHRAILPVNHKVFSTAEQITAGIPIPQQEHAFQPFTGLTLEANKQALSELAMSNPGVAERRLGTVAAQTRLQGSASTVLPTNASSASSDVSGEQNARVTPSTSVDNLAEKSDYSTDSEPITPAPIPVSMPRTASPISQVTTGTVSPFSAFNKAQQGLPIRFKQGLAASPSLLQASQTSQTFESALPASVVELESKDTGFLSNSSREQPYQTSAMTHATQGEGVVAEPEWNEEPFSITRKNERTKTSLTDANPCLETLNEQLARLVRRHGLLP